MCVLPNLNDQTTVSLWAPNNKLTPPCVNGNLIKPFHKEDWLHQKYAAKYQERKMAQIGLGGVERRAQHYVAKTASFDFGVNMTAPGDDSAETQSV